MICGDVSATGNGLALQMSDYHFARDNGVYLVTTPTPAADGWRLLDGHVATHARGRVVCVNLFGPDALLTADVMQAWADWWEKQYASR